MSATLSGITTLLSFFDVKLTPSAALLRYVKGLKSTKVPPKDLGALLPQDWLSDDILYGPHEVMDRAMLWALSALTIC